MNLKIRMANNEELAARLEVWVAAVLDELPPETRSRVFERIRKGNIFFQTPGSRILHAEPGVIKFRED